MLIYLLLFKEFYTTNDNLFCKKIFFSNFNLIRTDLKVKIQRKILIFFNLM